MQMLDVQARIVTDLLEAAGVQVRGELWTIPEAAEALGVTPDVIRTWLTRGLHFAHPDVRLLWSSDVYDRAEEAGCPRNRDASGRFVGQQHSSSVWSVQRVSYAHPANRTPE